MTLLPAPAAPCPCCSPPFCCKWLQGLVLIGPALHIWYGSLGGLVKAGGNTGAVMRMALDQLCFAPVFISGGGGWLGGRRGRVGGWVYEEDAVHCVSRHVGRRAQAGRCGQDASAACSPAPACPMHSAATCASAASNRSLPLLVSHAQPTCPS